jgi:sporulation protein YlmC with PRC-barrel domain
MLLKQLRGLPVIDPTAARKIGTVADYQVDPASGCVAALDIDGVGDADGERVLAQRIRRVGSSAVVLTARGGAANGLAPEINEHWLDTSTLVGLEVMGDDGNRIGSLVDAVFDQDTLQLEAYLLQADLIHRLIGRGGRIEPNSVHASSRDLMVVKTGRAEEAEPAPEEKTVPLEVPVPMKEEDRVSSPTFEPVADGQAVGARPD